MFDSYAVLSGLADKAKEVQMATFVTCLGAEAVDVLNELPFARDDDEKDLETVLKRMDEHFIGQTNVIFERFKFNERKQEEGGTTSQYIVAIPNLARRCDFRDITPEEILREDCL